MVLRAGLEPARITPHAPQTCAATNYATSANYQKNYLFELVVLAAGAIAAFVSAELTVTPFVLTVTFGCKVVFAAFKSTVVFALASVKAGAVSVWASGLLVCKTETFPFKAGIARNKADNIKTTAAVILIFARIVCVPRGLNAELEILLVKSAPASVFPGCNKTDAIKTMHETKNKPYKK